MPTKKPSSAAIALVGEEMARILCWINPDEILMLADMVYCAPGDYQHRIKLMHQATYTIWLVQGLIEEREDESHGKYYVATNKLQPAAEAAHTIVQHLEIWALIKDFVRA